MQPKVRIALSVFTFVALVLTGLAAAEQVPDKIPVSGVPLISPDLISLSPKLMRKKRQFETPEQELRATDSLILRDQISK